MNQNKFKPIKLTQRFLVIIACIFIGGCALEVKQFSENDIHIIPKPASLELQTGVFEFTENTKFILSSANKGVTTTITEKFSNATGWKLETIDKAPQKNYIELIVDESYKNEAYSLVVAQDKITIMANGNSGFLYGLETLRQLLPTEIESEEEINNISWVVPQVKIEDFPRYQWRGLMLDVSRHFFEKSYIKQVIDGLAMHKMNVLHLHLVDDQGWRIEIKKYPKLTDIGAFRVNQENAHWNNRKVTTAEEKGDFGGFYTQEDLKEIVSYATSKGIEVIPEIEMPAHVMSAIAAYPELSCFETPFGVPSGGVWPITEIYCAGKESTFEFLENVLLEVMELFPSKYIHIGGDEATKTNWAKCNHCENRMHSEGLHDVEELQSYFIKRIEKFINSHDRKLIGWDEILEGGLAPDATVMSWRGVKGGVEAAKQGHDVVMTPGTHCYFDHYQGPQDYEPLAIGGFTPLSKVYQFDPTVNSMTVEEAKHVLGGQANLWSEYVTTESHSQYMIFPRLAALSETVWSPKNTRDWDDFSTRLISMFRRYEHLGINYAKSAYLVTADIQIDTVNKKVAVLLKNEFPNYEIKYTLNDPDLTKSSPKYVGSIQLMETTTINASLFENGKPIGKQFNKTIKFHKGVGKKVTYKEPFNERYQGAGAHGMVNALRGTKNFRDGQWQAWLGKDMEVIIDLEKETAIHEVIVGSMENQGPGIYYPTEVTVFVSNDGENFEKAGSITRAYASNAGSELQDFKVTFAELTTKYVKVVATNLKSTPKGGGVWLFVDEILID